MTRFLAIALIALPLAYSEQTAKLAFEAATIKPDNHDRSGEIGGSCRGRDTRQSRVPLGRCVFDRVTLKQLGRDNLGYNGPASRIGDLASFLTGQLRRPVIDKTGLTGTYDVNLRWISGVGERSGGPAPTSGVASEPGPTLFAALQEQLGLRLESTRVTIDAFVIDSAERPTGH